MATEFQFKKIVGKLSIEEAGLELVHLATKMQDASTNEMAARFTKAEMMHLFELRRSGMNALMNLIEAYIDQIPDE